MVRVEVTPERRHHGRPIASDQVTVADANRSPPTFRRTVANAWGTADLGGAYTLQGTAADYGVNGSAGTMQP